jgi:predicted metal-dependent phosphoesterase TrpH
VLKADLHIHTEYSMDSRSALEDIIKRCLEIGINCITIADHGTVEGALKMQGLAPFPVIVAEEILTQRGEIMGMFIKEKIPGGLSMEQTIAQIRAQDGLVCVPHPFDTFRGSALGAEAVEAIADQIDVVEVFNARAIRSRDSARAQAFARKHGICGSAGSDAHTIREIGHAYVEMPEFKGRDDFLQALEQGKIHGHMTNPLIHFRGLARRIKSLFR